MFARVLIANRSEIASRIGRTLRRLGVRWIAVYSDPDQSARHVLEADQAVRLGPAEARLSYLNTASILEAAARIGAEAIHPGYGFLSENPDFARACANAGIVFIGPTPEAMDAMGVKDRARMIVEGAGVPIVPGWDDDRGDDAALQEAARNLGPPLIVKAAAGGGGKGMRVVRDLGGLGEAIAGARREAEAAFGDDRLLIERLIERSRHIEVQVFGDRFGNVVHLFERDCSVQRRHQKVIEEAPAPGLSDSLRAALHDAAVRAAKAVGYQNAGTVEFLLDDQNRFFFIEMNARLQVEHPVTEAITGLDLVAWQLRVAAGEPLPLAQSDISVRGHAIEARLYAEDPARGHLPSTGRLATLELPQGEGIRVDSGVEQGDLITEHYDPMIAKVIAHGPDRETARRRLVRALDAAVVIGPATNLDLLGRIAREPAFADERIDTGFLDHGPESLVEPLVASPDEFLDAAICLLGQRLEDAKRHAATSVDPDSPWRRVDGWRLNDIDHQTLRLRSGPRTLEIEARMAGDAFVFELDGRTVEGSVRRTEGSTWLVQRSGHAERLKAVVTSRGVVLATPRGRLSVEMVDPLVKAEPHDQAEGRLTAPMPGRIIRVLVQPGDHVRQATPLIVLEAMKMEHTIMAPAAGTIVAVSAVEGERVEEGLILIEIKEDA